MNSVSFIICGDNLGRNKLEQLHAKLRTFINKTPPECIVYFNSKLPLEVYETLTLVHSSTKTTTSLQKAVATATGNNMVFTTIETILADSKMALLDQSQRLKDFMVAAPLQPGHLRSLLGFRKINKAPYFITSKSFATSNSLKLKNPSRAINYANRHLAFIGLQSAVTNSPNFMIRDLLFTRPYLTITKHFIKIRKDRVSNYFEERRVNRLRNQVPAVLYSPNIPVFIICRDRVEPLKALVKWCEDENLKNIILIDNNSTYEPLLKYFKNSSYEVIRLNSNVGHTAPWRNGIVDIYAAGKPFIVTDPDVVPLKEAHGAIKHFCVLLTRHPERTKVGFGLKIDDLPDTYALKDHVIAWESQFWVSEVEEEVFDAEIDTTFALYRQNTPYTLGPGLRTGGNFVARHEPWYVNSSKISSEIKYYREHADPVIGSWGTNEAELTQTYLQHKQKFDGIV